MNLIGLNTSTIHAAIIKKLNLYPCFRMYKKIKGIVAEC